jgi:hypothetical protein
VNPSQVLRDLLATVDGLECTLCTPSGDLIAAASSEQASQTDAAELARRAVVAIEHPDPGWLRLNQEAPVFLSQNAFPAVVAFRLRSRRLLVLVLPEAGVSSLVRVAIPKFLERLEAM